MPEVSKKTAEKKFVKFDTEAAIPITKEAVGKFEMFSLLVDKEIPLKYGANNNLAHFFVSFSPCKAGEEGNPVKTPGSKSVRISF